MAFVDAVSNSTTAANTDALLFPAISNSLLIVRAGVYLTASGSNSHAINAPADNLTLAMDGYAAAENASAILFTAHSEILIGASGVVASGDRAIEGSGSDNEIINNGSLASNGYGIYLASSGHTVTNNGAILSGSLSGIFIAEGNSRVTNAGVLTTGGAGISILVVGTLSNSLVTNSGQINADYIGISLQGSDVLVSNSGTIQSIAC